MGIFFRFFDPAGVLHGKAVPGEGILTTKNRGPGVNRGGGGGGTGQSDTTASGLISEPAQAPQ